MRRLGIKQWPYRKRTSAKKITNSLEVGRTAWPTCLPASYSAHRLLRQLSSPARAAKPCSAPCLLAADPLVRTLRAPFKAPCLTDSGGPAQERLPRLSRSCGGPPRPRLLAPHIARPRAHTPRCSLLLLAAGVHAQVRRPRQGGGRAGAGAHGAGGVRGLAHGCAPGPARPGPQARGMHARWGQPRSCTAAGQRAGHACAWGRPPMPGWRSRRWASCSGGRPCLRACDPGPRPPRPQEPSRCAPSWPRCGSGCTSWTTR